MVQFHIFIETVSYLRIYFHNSLMNKGSSKEQHRFRIEIV